MLPVSASAVTSFCACLFLLMLHEVTDQRYQLAQTQTLQNQTSSPRLGCICSAHVSLPLAVTPCDISMNHTDYDNSCYSTGNMVVTHSASTLRTWVQFPYKLKCVFYLLFTAAVKILSTKQFFAQWGLRLKIHQCSCPTAFGRAVGLPRFLDRSIKVPILDRSRMRRYCFYSTSHPSLPTLLPCSHFAVLLLG